MAEQKKQRRPKSSRKKKVNIKLVALSIIGLFILFTVLIVGFMGVVLAKNYEIDESKLEMREATVIYDKDGQEVEKLFLENRKYLSFNEIPDQLKDAFIAVEDQRFYDHQGIDPRSIARALYRDIIARSMVEGGSTITQQLAKNVFLTNEKKWLRKTEEVLIAVNLEKQYSKEEILEMYLNYINFGNRAYGIAAASQAYFGKSVDQLELGEMAMLAALPKAPSHYNPLKEKNQERSEQRRLLVLRLMADQGRITEEEREKAANTPLQLNEKGVTEDPALFTYVDMVLEEAEEKYGLSSDDILTGGFEIYTALDLNAQRAMYEAFWKDSSLAEELFPAPGPEHIVQGGMVIMDHHTGSVVAAMGGRDYVRRGTNRATAEARQPGSSFKPIAVFSPALELGWHPYDILKDEQMTFGGNYTPRNYDREFRGEVTMIEAMSKSYNVPAVWLLNEMGIAKGIDSITSFGFNQSSRELGIALGGNIEVSPLGMTEAFGTFANNGLKMESYLIERIVDKNGIPISRKQLEHQQIVTAQTSWYMTKMLESVVKDGTGKRAKISHPVAGKTGTTQAANGQSGVRDAWFVGYTPYYTAAVWMGFDQASEGHVMNTTGGNHPAKVFNYVMEKALESKPVIAFEKPSGVKDLEPPVRLEQIQDLQAFLSLNWDFSLSVDLDFTPNKEDRVLYRIYRTDGETQVRSLLDEVTKAELTDGRRWTDRDISLGSTYYYEVVPVNTLNGLEGEPSNMAVVEVTPFSILPRQGNEEEMEEFEKWLRDLEDQFNGDLNDEGTVDEAPEEEIDDQQEKPGGETEGETEDGSNETVPPSDGEQNDDSNGKKQKNSQP
jgi:penicillin-binding protein 2A